MHRIRTAKISVYKFSISSVFHLLAKRFPILMIGALLFGCAPNDSFYNKQRIASRNGSLSSNPLLRGNGLNCLLKSPAGYRNSPPTLATYRLIAEGVLDERILKPEYRHFAKPILRGDSYTYFKSILKTTGSSSRNLYNAINLLEAQDQICLSRSLNDLFEASRQLKNNSNSRLLTYSGKMVQGEVALTYLENTIQKIQDTQKASLDWHLGLFQDFDSSYAKYRKTQQQRKHLGSNSTTLPPTPNATLKSANLVKTKKYRRPSIILRRINIAHEVGQIGDDINPNVTLYINKRRRNSAIDTSVVASPVSDDLPVFKSGSFRRHPDICRLSIHRTNLCQGI